MKHYRMTHQEWCNSSRRLKPAELKVLYYLRTFDPFGETWLDIQVSAIADDLGMNKSTVSRALKQLTCSGDIDLEIQVCRVRLRSHVQRLSTDNSLRTDNLLSTDNFDDRYTTSAIATQHLNDHSDLKPLQGGSSEKGECTNNKKNLLKEQQTIGASTIGIDRKAIGTEALIDRIQKAGVLPNKTIQKTIAQLSAELGTPAATAKAVENAISALREQQQAGTVRNPSGFLVAALRGNFTANEAKRQARNHPAGGQPPPEVPDLYTVAAAIDRALIAGDRPFALLKLNTLWAEGWQEQVQELCLLRKQDWGFTVSTRGVGDGR
ncbi:helix-turn-helix domain-containing protein [Leptolyngbya sp. FACHB-36]|uniref:helix-turn-helix domain-containing protein n=1 Tax=Leptolyngbya sp. FACHB-36 TaxID=2692808 RepID=UPI001680AF0E|nr:helix-turn-helix domain-containing protein [Leptolyngbya sp. FACHB-36]MBD2019231.1 helix-turn-helix domain-containing protein [Leptolyngbya sp. FACHB-36]